MTTAYGTTRHAVQSIFVMVLVSKREAFHWIIWVLDVLHLQYTLSDCTYISPHALEWNKWCSYWHITTANGKPQLRPFVANAVTSITRYKLFSNSAPNMHKIQINSTCAIAWTQLISSLATHLSFCNQNIMQSLQTAKTGQRSIF